MSRIIILSDIYDVRGTGGTKFRSHFLEEEEREDMISHAKLDKLLDIVYNPKSNSNYAAGKYVGSSKYNFWTRYMGPYTIASNIREKCPDWDVVVLDYFTKLDNFFEVFEQLVTPDTKYIYERVDLEKLPFLSYNIADTGSTGYYLDINRNSGFVLAFNLIHQT